MKKYLLGFLVGVFMTASSTSIMAAVQNYTLTKYETPVYIQGVKYPTDALPVMSYDVNGGSNTYVPLRNFAEMMGATVTFDSANNRINITMDKDASTSVTTDSIGTTTGNTATVNSNNKANPSNQSGNNGKTVTDAKNKDKNKDKDKTTTTTPAPDSTQSSTGTTDEKITVEKSFDSIYNLNVYTINGVKYVMTDDIEEYYFDDDYKSENDDYDFEDNSSGTLTIENNDTVILEGITANKLNDEYYIEFDYFVSTVYPAIK